MKKGLLRSGISISLLTMASRVLGLFREMTKAAFLGTTPLADAFGIAFMIPNLFRRLFAENSISVAFIPAFRAYLDDEDRGTTLRFVSSVLTVVTFLTAIIVTAGIIASPVLVPLFYDPTKTDTLTEMVFLTRLMFPYLLLISMAAFFQGILNGLKIFTPSAFTPILFNLIVIGCTYALSPFVANPARAMAIGVVSGGLVQAAFQVPFVVHTHWAAGLTGLRKAFANPGLRKVLARIAPTTLGMAAYQLNDLVSTALAGRAGPGIVAALQYSLRLQELLLGVFAVSIGTVILPDLSGLAKKQDWNAFYAMLALSVKIIALVTIPVTFFALVTGESIITVVYRGQSFNAGSVALTLQVFLCHISGLFFIACNRIIAPAFYAQGDTKRPTYAGLAGFAVNIVLACLLVRPFGGPGIAISLSIASAVNTLALVVFLTRRPAQTQLNKALSPEALSLIRYIVKMLVFSLAAAVALYFAQPVLLRLFGGLAPRLQHGITLITGTLIFAVIGVGLLVASRDELVGRIVHIKGNPPAMPG